MSRILYQNKRKQICKNSRWRRILSSLSYSKIKIAEVNAHKFFKMFSFQLGARFVKWWFRKYRQWWISTKWWRYRKQPVKQFWFANNKNSPVWSSTIWNDWISQYERLYKWLYCSHLKNGFMCKICTLLLV